MPSSDTGVEAAVEVIAEILCAWDYRDDSGQTWPTLSDVGRDSFRMQATQLLEGSMPDRSQSALDLIRRQERQRVREALKTREVVRRAWEERPVGKKAIKGLTWLDSFRETIDAGFAALDSLEDPDA